MSDLISRKDAIKAIMYGNSIDIVDRTKLEQRIKELPAIEAEPVVHAEWKEAKPRGVTRYSKGYAECSACHNIVWSGWEMDFCPKCGARMDGKKVEE